MPTVTITDANFNTYLTYWKAKNIGESPTTPSGWTTDHQVLGNWDISAVTNLRDAFKNYTGEFYVTNWEGDITNWNTISVTTMREMFRNYSNPYSTTDDYHFNQDISKWNTSKVTNMYYMFANDSYNNGGEPLLTNYITADNSPTGSAYTAWDVSNVTIMHSMFRGNPNSIFNQEISNWDTSNVTNISYMFGTAGYGWTNTFNQDVSTKYITSANSPYKDSSGNGIAYTAWDVSNVKYMIGTFFNASEFNGDITDWDTKNVLNMKDLFNGAKKIFSGSTNITGWNVSKVTNMYYMFAIPNSSDNNPRFNQDIGSWDTSNVTNMEQMFRYQNVFNHDIRLWNVSSVKNMNGMFYGCSLFNQNINKATQNSGQTSEYVSWDTQSVTDMVSMFAHCTNFNGNIVDWDVSNVKNMLSLFNNARNFDKDISSWDVSDVTSMAYMFQNANVFNQDLSKWKTNGSGMQSTITTTNMFSAATAMLNNGTGVAVSPTYANWETQTNCFYGFVDIMTDCGLKQIKDLKRGDLVLTNDGYQPLSLLSHSANLKTYNGKQLMVKIPKNFFAENIPSKDIYTTETHPLSVKVLSDKDDKDFEFLHLFVKELFALNDDDKKIEYEYLKEEKYIYNLIFDKHYQLNIGGMKFLSHHPNHNNGNLRLTDKYEIDHNNRSKKVYADKKGIYFKIATLKELLSDKPEHMSDKEYLSSILCFN